MHHEQGVLDTEEHRRTEVAARVASGDFVLEFLTIPPEGRPEDTIRGAVLKETATILLQVLHVIC